MRNLITLCIAQFFGAFGQVTMVILAGLVGALLAPDPSLATLPAAFAVVGIASATVPAAMSMQRFGRRRVFIAGTLLAAAGTLTAAEAISTGNFWLFCAGTMLIGANTAFIAQYRFAAAESVAEPLVSRAVAWIMLGTVGAALIGPPTVVAVRGWTPTEYVGSFLFLAGIYLASAATLLALRESAPSSSAPDGPARPLAEIARQPGFAAAVLAAAVGYGVMAMIMTATPLSMHVHDGHSVEDTALVIQGHVLAMYAPSLASGWLVATLGARRMIVFGALAEIACIAIALNGHGVGHYAAALIALGIGWNLMFVAGTTLLTRSYRPEERFRVQAFNDFCMFGVMAAASLLAGVLINATDWRWLNGLALLPLLALLALIRIAREPRVAEPAARR
ncbi:MAG: MFS transporter [Gammaproteobacteria bacterium]